MTALWHHVNTSRHERSSRRIDENQKAINRLYINSSWAKRICFFYCVILSTWACTRPRSADGYQSRQVDVSHPERVAIVTGTIETPKKKKEKMPIDDSRSSSSLEIAFHHRTAAKSDKVLVFSKLISSAFVFPTIGSWFIAIHQPSNHIHQNHRCRKKTRQKKNNSKQVYLLSAKFHFSDGDMGENAPQRLQTYKLIVNLNSLSDLSVFSLRQARSDYWR